MWLASRVTTTTIEEEEEEEEERVLRKGGRKEGREGGNGGQGKFDDVVSEWEDRLVIRRPSPHLTL